MEKERPKPPRPKHRTNVEQRELSPPPLPPRLSDFILPKVQNAETSDERTEQSANETKVEVDEKENRGVDRQER